jgi:hypothetical protein
MLSLSEKSTPCKNIRPRRIASRLHPALVSMLHPALKVAFVQYAYRTLTMGPLDLASTVRSHCICRYQLT